MSNHLFQRLRDVLSEAMEERRGLVVYSRLKAVEMDRMAREVERRTLETVRGLLSEESDDQRVLGVRNRLERMRDDLDRLEGETAIRAQSRQMQIDDILWQTFEDVAWMLGIR
jgi:hypothetical protein